MDVRERGWSSQKEQAACWQTRSYVLCWLEFFGAPDDLGIIEGMLLPLHDFVETTFVCVFDSFRLTLNLWKSGPTARREPPLVSSSKRLTE